MLPSHPSAVDCCLNDPVAIENNGLTFLQNVIFKKEYSPRCKIMDAMQQATGRSFLTSKMLSDLDMRGNDERAD